MADILTLGGGAPINLLDKTKFLGLKQANDSINRIVEYSPGGCFGVPGKTAILRKAKTLFYERKYTLTVTGYSIDNALANLYSVRDVLLGAEAANLKLAFNPKAAFPQPHEVVPAEAWLIRQLRDQTYPLVWTVLYGSGVESAPEFMSLTPIEIVQEFTMALMEGAEFVDTSGFPIIGVQG